jgi:glycosyltransferase involved in cell wall biosynthesis
VPEQPLVSIVTPCYNAARFLPAAVASVLSQDYPNLEYIVVDGGSTDETVDLLRSYDGRLRWVSAKDGGPAEAINRGFRAARGSILGWLNADDQYTPGAVAAAVRHLAAAPGLGAVYGQGIWIDAAGARVGPYPIRAFDRALLARECYVCQPACFFRRQAFEEAGGLDASLQFAFDYELWIRMSARAPFQAVPECFAASRMHPANRTLGQRRRVFMECMQVLERHFGYIPFQWIFAYCCYLVDRRDQFYDPMRPSLLKYALSLPVGLFHNPRSMARYSREWVSKMSSRPFALYFNETWLGRKLHVQLPSAIHKKF